MLETAAYNASVVTRYVAAQRHFLEYIHREHVALEAVEPRHFDSFVSTMLRRYRRRHQHSPNNLAAWRSQYTSSVFPLLRRFQISWPHNSAVHSRLEHADNDLLAGYSRWLIGVRGLSKETLAKNYRAARLFVQWQRDQARECPLSCINIAEIDAFFAWRMQGLRRATRSGVCHCMRSFLRYLFVSKNINADLSNQISGPIMYDSADIPRGFSEDQIAAMLKCARQDKSPKGLRDYAMLTMLATYGLRAGEVVKLSLQDIDWKKERIRVIRSKSQAETFLPLIQSVGKALIDYLKRGRPESTSRRIFLRCRAPSDSLFTASGLDGIINSRLKEAEIKVNGRHGAHAFRFARALSLLRASVPLKPIVDILGHRTSSSTQMYLKLQTEDLRAISLELPKEGFHANVAR